MINDDWKYYQIFLPMGHETVTIRAISMSVNKHLSSVATVSSQVYLSQIFYPLEQFLSIPEDQTLETKDIYLIEWNLDNFRCLIGCALILRNR